MLTRPLYRLLFILLIAMPLASDAQSLRSKSRSEKDSLARLLDEAKEENAKIFEEINLANSLIKSQPDQALIIFFIV